MAAVGPVNKPFARLIRREDVLAFRTTEGTRRGCPTPVKVTFGTEAEARSWIEGSPAYWELKDAATYRCVCGSFHLTKFLTEVRCTS